MRIIVIYDDTGKKSEVIEDIIGEKGFSDVVVRKRRLEDYYREELERIYPGLVWKKIRSNFAYADLVKEVELYAGPDVRVMHCFANYLISDSQKASLSFKKLSFIDEVYGVFDGKRAAACMFPDVGTYLSFCKKVMSGQKAWDLIRGEKASFEIEGLVDIGIINHFIQCITGNFDSRFFNSFQENEYTLTKSSANKEKIKAEYRFYQMLPEDMKFWFVMPFNYREAGHTASYSMERLHMTDLAIKWVHGSMNMTEFDELLDKYFFFFRSRHEKMCTKDEYQNIADSLYKDKVSDRIADLKKHADYGKIAALLDTCEHISIDDLAVRYFSLKEKIEARIKYPYRLVIGHGDPCFANTMYNKSTQTLKFIDPKGALTEEELWTNPYYDVAKLSHSVCGRYDFFNNALFDIRIDETFSCVLEIPFDNCEYQEIFRNKAAENGFDYLSVRIYEASLFLSMLPLHMDNPHKVFGFIMNVKNILKEIEENV